MKKRFSTARYTSSRSKPQLLPSEYQAPEIEENPFEGMTDAEVEAYVEQRKAASEAMLDREIIGAMLQACKNVIAARAANKVE